MVLWVLLRICKIVSEKKYIGQRFVGQWDGNDTLQMFSLKFFQTGLNPLRLCFNSIVLRRTQTKVFIFFKNSNKKGNSLNGFFFFFSLLLLLRQIFV